MAPDLPKNQRLVLECLRAVGGHALTAYELLARLSPAGLRGPQTVYRALESLRQAGLVHRIESLNAFSACTHAHDHDHRPAFAVCRRCGAVAELDDAALNAVVNVAALRTGYAVEERVLELVGTCPDCHAAS